MIYKEENDYIRRYNMMIDFEKLKKVRDEMFYNLSDVRNVKVTKSLSCMCASYKFWKRVDNLNSKKLDGDVYELSYKYYDYPYIVDLIDDLIKSYNNFNTYEELGYKVLNYNGLDEKYLLKIKECFNLILVDEIDINSYNKVYSFVDDDMKCYLNKKIKR